MQRRKFLAGMGSLAAASAVGISTGAFSTATAERTMSVDVANDHNAYLGLDPSISEYASLNSNGVMELQFDGSNGQNGAGLNDEATTKFHNVFKVVNNGTNPVNVLLTNLDTTDDTDSGGDGVDPIAVMFTYNEQESHVPAWSQYGDSNRDKDLLWGSPNPLQGPESWRPDGEWYMELNPGDNAYVHMALFTEDPESDVAVKDAMPTSLKISAQGAANEFTGRGIDE